MQWFEIASMVAGTGVCVHFILKGLKSVVKEIKELKVVRKNSDTLLEQVDYLTTLIEDQAIRISEIEGVVSKVEKHKDYLDISLYHLLANARLNHLVVLRDAEENEDYEACKSCKKFIENVDMLLKYRRDMISEVNEVKQ